jgi:PAS domain-containing protein
MLEIGLFAILFFTSILLACAVLKTRLEKQTLPTAGTNHTEMLMHALDMAPFPVWAENKNGPVWANRVTERIGGDISKIGTLAFSFPTINPARRAGRVGRLVKKNSGTGLFTIFNHKLDNTEYYFAFAGAGSEIQKPAKTPDRFIQTMSVTFAHLQVGIAVFDAKNELSLFNPALSEHLGLRPEWLLKKPNLLGFLDRLRNTHILPEPKNYTSWRKTFLQIERSAMKDDYREDWGLPDGRSLRVIGRPHPSGTVVFIFEDVTTTLAMERDFRSQVSCLKSTLDTVSAGLVVFDRSGNTVLLNDPLKQSFGPHSTLNTIQDFSRLMQEIFQPTPIWGDLRQYVEDTNERSAWQADIKTRAGETVLIDVAPVTTGSTLCEFHFPLKINQEKHVGLTCAAQ